MEDEKWMMLALEQARLAADRGETPIGAVLVGNGELLAAAHNHRERDHDVTSHAEIEVLREAGRKKGDWRLSECTLYVTLEPCPMCAGAILNARIGKVCFALKDANAGALGSVLNLNSYPLLHKVKAESGLCEEESRELLSSFFKERRRK